MTTTSANLKTLLNENTIPGADALTRPEKDGAVRCLACGHRCLIRPGKAAVCKVRFNQERQLRVPGGYVAALQIDPIEKKPFYHAYPGRDALSFGMLGCDLHCSYCQNWVTSQALRDDAAVALPRFCQAQDLIDLALGHDAPVVVSTYNEPLITAEWSVKVFEQARKAGLTCGFVSNGNATPEVLEFLRPLVSLYKVDLKSFDDKHYRELGCTLQNVLDSIEGIHGLGFWLEIVTLVIPGFNDGEDELRGMAKFLANISPDIPWHLTAFHPDYKMQDTGRTQVNTLLRAYDIGREAGLRYVYPGNVPGAFGERENTHCPDCGTTLIERRGFHVVGNRMAGSACPECEAIIPGMWESEAPKRSTGSGFPVPIRL